MMSSTTEKVIGILGDRLEPLQNQFDSDSDYPSIHDIIFFILNIFSNCVLI